MTTGSSGCITWLLSETGRSPIPPGKMSSPSSGTKKIAFSRVVRKRPNPGRVMPLRCSSTAFISERNCVM